MNKKHLFESVMISSLFVILVSTVVYAGYPGPDEDIDYGYGDYGSYVLSYVVAAYSDPETYTQENYFSYAYRGSAEFDGPMYYCWFIDDVYIQGYDASGYKTGDSGIDCTLVATYTVCNFKHGVEEWGCNALAVRQIY